MKKALTLAALLAASWAATPALANPEELAKKSGCLACHTVDKKLVGPAYRDIAKKYATQKDAAAKLAAKVKAGGSGVWGPVPMPPNSAVKDADIKTIVGWVLSLK